MGRGIHGPLSLDEFETLSAHMAIKERCELIGGIATFTKRETPSAHHLIVDNIIVSLMVTLRAKSSAFRPVGTTFWLKHRSLALAVQPDVMIYEGRMFPAATSLDDPTVIVEIAVPDAAEAHQAEKWKLYKKLRSLQHYVLVERDRVGIDVFERIDGGWFFRPRLEDIAATLSLPAVGVDVPLADIYRETGLG